MASKAVDIEVAVVGKLSITLFSLIRSTYPSVAGPTGSGKTSLAARFVSTCIIFALSGNIHARCSVIKHKHIYRRPADRRSFRFILSERDSSSCDLWKEFQFVLVTLDLAQTDGSLHPDVMTLARQISKSARQPDMICVLVTSFAQDPFKVEFWTIPTCWTFVENLQCYGVSAFDGTGISDVQRFIGTVLVNVSLSSTL
jgi:hypothetical protein